MAISVFLLNVVTYRPDFFPPMFIEEYGLTKYKIYSEYLIVILFAVVALVLIFEYKKKKDNVIFLFVRVPSMGNNLVVKVHYGLGSRNR